MAYEHKDNSGTLFNNERKENERQPDFTGNVLIGKELIGRIQSGETLRLAGWSKTTSGGKQIVSLAVSEQRERQDEKTDVPF